jgi:hypothetical protein
LDNVEDPQLKLFFDKVYMLTYWSTVLAVMFILYA